VFAVIQVQLLPRALEQNIGQVRYMLCPVTTLYNLVSVKARTLTYVKVYDPLYLL